METDVLKVMADVAGVSQVWSSFLCPVAGLPRIYIEALPELLFGLGREGNDPGQSPHCAPPTVLGKSILQSAQRSPQNVLKRQILILLVGTWRASEPAFLTSSCVISVLLVWGPPLTAAVIPFYG